MSWELAASHCVCRGQLCPWGCSLARVQLRLRGKGSVARGLRTDGSLWSMCWLRECSHRPPQCQRPQLCVQITVCTDARAACSLANVAFPFSPSLPHTPPGAFSTTSKDCRLALLFKVPRARPGLVSRPRMLPGWLEPPPEPLAGCPWGQCVRGRLSPRGTWTHVHELSFRHGATWQVPRPGAASSSLPSLLLSCLLSSLLVCGAPVSLVIFPVKQYPSLPLSELPGAPAVGARVPGPGQGGREPPVPAL